jgi:lysophospholipase L1-like esterase
VADSKAYLGWAEAFVTIGSAILLGKTLYDMAAPSTPAGPAPIVQPGDAVLLVGDSIGVGLASPLKSALAASNVTLDTDVAVGRSITTQAADGYVPQGAYKVILLSLGSNDTAAKGTEQATLQRYVTWLQDYLVPGGKILWVLPPSFTGTLTAAQQAVLSEFQAVNIPAVPIQGSLPSVASDTAMHLHPTPQGYQTYAKQIAQAIVTPNLPRS